MQRTPDLLRRRMTRIGLTAMAGAFLFPAFTGVPRATRMLALRNLQTDEKLRVAYWGQGSYNRAGLDKINDLMRDHVTGLRRPIDLRLVDLMHDLQTKLGHDGEIEIISAYRAPAGQHSSLHAEGMAADLRLPGIALPKIQEAALALNRGGVSFYPGAPFVHIDVGA